MKILALLGLVAVGTNALRVAEQQHDGQYAWYTFDEGPSGNRCTNADQCDGQRTCSSLGWCLGKSRPPKGINYYYNEEVTKNACPKDSTDRDWKNRDYYCDGKRTCSDHGWCQGTSRP